MIQVGIFNVFGTVEELEGLRFAAQLAGITLPLNIVTTRSGTPALTYPSGTFDTARHKQFEEVKRIAYKIGAGPAQ